MYSFYLLFILLIHSFLFNQVKKKQLIEITDLIYKSELAKRAATINLIYKFMTWKQHNQASQQQCTRG